MTGFQWTGPLTSNRPSAHSVNRFAKALSNRYWFTLTSFELNTATDRIIIGKSLKLLSHCLTNALEFVVTSITIPILFLSTLTLVGFCCSYKWDKVFKSGPSKICGRQLLKNFTWSTLEYFVQNVLEINQGILNFGFIYSKWNHLLHFGFLKSILPICRDFVK